MASNKFPPAIRIDSQTDKSGTLARCTFAWCTLYGRAGGIMTLAGACISSVFADAAKENFTLRRPRTDNAELLIASASTTYGPGTNIPQGASQILHFIRENRAAAA
jgi:hypothetical protein